MGVKVITVEITFITAVCVGTYYARPGTSKAGATRKKICASKTPRRRNEYVCVRTGIYMIQWRRARVTLAATLELGTENAT